MVDGWSSASLQRSTQGGSKEQVCVGAGQVMGRDGFLYGYSCVCAQVHEIKQELKPEKPMSIEHSNDSSSELDGELPT